MQIDTIHLVAASNVVVVFKSDRALQYSTMHQQKRSLHQQCERSQLFDCCTYKLNTESAYHSPLNAVTNLGFWGGCSSQLEVAYPKRAVFTALGLMLWTNRFTLQRIQE